MKKEKLERLNVIIKMLKIGQIIKSHIFQKKYVWNATTKNANVKDYNIAIQEEMKVFFLLKPAKSQTKFRKMVDLSSVMLYQICANESERSIFKYWINMSKPQ